MKFKHLTQKVTIVSILALVVMTGTAVAKEVTFVGTFYGQLPFQISPQEIYNVAYNNGTSAERSAIQKMKKDAPRWVQETLRDRVNQDQDAAVEVCTSKGFTYAAITNVNYQVVHDENVINLYWSLNILCWNRNNK